MGDTMATQEAYVQVKDLKKHYGDGDARLTVLDGIDTSINRGEICVMLGPSGSGKSTFLNLIGGLEDADGGSIMVDGCDLTVLKPTDLGEYRRRELGFVFQFYNLVPDLTIKENIEVTAHLSKTRSTSTTCCVRWASTSTATSSRARFRVASSSVAPSAAHSSKTRACCCATSPRARSTIRRPRKSCSSWKMSITSTAAPSSLSPTMPPSLAWPTACCACATGASSLTSSTSRPCPPPSSIGRRRHDTSRKTSPARAAPQYR